MIYCCRKPRYARDLCGRKGDRFGSAEEESPDSTEQGARRKSGPGNRRLEPQRPMPQRPLGSEKGNPPRCNPKHGRRRCSPRPGYGAPATSGQGWRNPEIDGRHQQNLAYSPPAYLFIHTHRSRIHIQRMCCRTPRPRIRMSARARFAPALEPPALERRRARSSL